MIKKLEKINHFIGESVAWLLVLMMLITVSVVVLRYLFNLGSIALQESVTYFHAAVFILAAAYTLQNNGHVRVDIFYQHMSQQKKAMVNIFGSIFLLGPVCIFIAWVSLPYVRRSWEIVEKSNDAGGIPAIYLLKSLIIVLAISLFLQAFIDLTKNCLFLLGKGEDPNLGSDNHNNGDKEISSDTAGKL